MPNNVDAPDAIMRRSASLKIWIALSIMAAGGNASALDAEAIFERTSPSIWIVRTLDAQEKPLAQGSAVVIAPGKLVTNCHVLAKARYLQVRKDNVSYSASLEFPDPERDLCQISVRNFAAPAVTMGSMQNLKIGQRVYAIGNPLGLELTMSEGIISSLRGGTSEGAPLIQTTAAISRGSSGGGLFDSDGRLVGITTFYAKDSQNLNFAHPVDWITELPARGAAMLARSAASASSNAPGGQTASAFPRTLVGEEFLAHIRKLRRVSTSQPGLMWFGLRPNGSVETMVITPANPSGNPWPGSYKLSSSETSGSVCIAMMRSGGTGTVASGGNAAASLDGCFTVVQMAANKFALQSTTENFSIHYDFPG